MNQLCSNLISTTHKYKIHLSKAQYHASQTAGTMKGFFKQFIDRIILFNNMQISQSDLTTVLKTEIHSSR